MTLFNRPNPKVCTGSCGLLRWTYPCVHPAGITSADLSSLLSVLALDPLATAPMEDHSHAIGSPTAGQLEPSIRPAQTRMQIRILHGATTGQPACQSFSGRVNVCVCVCVGGCCRGFLFWPVCFSLSWQEDCWCHVCQLRD